MTILLFWIWGCFVTEIAAFVSHQFDDMSTGELIIEIVVGFFIWPFFLGVWMGEMYNNTKK